MRFKDRHKYLGASEVAQACGINEYGGTAYDLWREKTLRSPRQAEQAIFERGHMMEAMVAHILKTRYGTEITGGQAELVRPERPWLRSHIDGLMEFVDIGGGTVLVDAGGPPIGLGVAEIKAPGSSVIYKIRRDGVPADYLVQLQTNIHNASAAWGVLLFLDYDKWDILAVYMRHDGDMIQEVLKRADAFWHKVTNDIEPEQPEPGEPKNPLDAWANIENGGPMVLVTKKAADAASIYRACSERHAKSEELLADAKKNLTDLAATAGRALRVHIPIDDLNLLCRITTSKMDGKATVKGRELLAWTADLCAALWAGDPDENERALAMAKVFTEELFVSTGEPYTRTTINFKERSNDD